MSCSTDGCSKEGKWHPVLEMRSRKDGPAIRVTFSQLVFCDEHKALQGLASFLSAEGFVKIAKFLRENGKENPIQRNTTLAWTVADQKESDLLTTIAMPDLDTDDDLAF
jgi:hypothetical protein